MKNLCFVRLHGAAVASSEALRLVEFFLCVFGFYATIKVAISGTRLDIKPFNCSACMGFWAGWGFSLAFYKDYPWYEQQFYALMACGVCWMLNKWVTGDR